MRRTNKRKTNKRRTNKRKTNKRRKMYNKQKGGNNDFLNLCLKGDLDGAQEYLLLDPDINISAGDEFAFRGVCSKGYLAVAQWLLEVSRERGQEINISINDEAAFRLACSNGHLAVAQWLFEIKPDINVSAKNNFAFRHACINGNLDVAQWLYSINPHVINVNMDSDFALVCNRGFLEIAQWLLQIKPDINISANNNEAFTFACNNRFLNVVSWLASLNPAYEIIDRDSLNWRCKVLTDPKEIKWKRKNKAVWLASGTAGDNMIYRMPTDVARITASYL